MALGRPLLRTSYQEDAAIFPTYLQKVLVGLLVLVLVLTALGNSFFEAIPSICSVTHGSARSP